MLRSIFAFLGLFLVTSASAQTPTSIQFGVVRTTTPWTVCVYDANNTCQGFLYLPSTGGGAYTPPAYGGTGVNNGSNTITLGGNVLTHGALTMSGAYSFTGTLTGNTTVTFPTSGTLATTTTPAYSIAVGTTIITGGTSGYIEYNSGNVLGEKAVTGTGSVVLATSPTLVTPTLGVATATSLNGLTVSTTTGTLTIANGKTLTDTSGAGAVLLLGATGGGFTGYGGASACASSGLVTAISTAGATTCATNAPTSSKWAAARLLAGNSVDGSANVAFSNAFIVQGTADSGLSGAQFLGALGTGLVLNTTSTGVLSIYGGASACASSGLVTAISASGATTCTTNAPTSTTATNSVITTQTTGTFYPLFASSDSSASTGLDAAADLTFAAGSGGTLTTGTFVGAVTGHASADCALAGCTMSGNIAMGGNAITGAAGITGTVLTATATTQSTSSTTGAIIDDGGLGVAKNIYAAGLIAVGSPSGDGNPGYSVEAFPTTGGSFGAPAFNFNDQYAPAGSSDSTTHFAMTVVGNSPATGTGSYLAFSAEQYCTGRNTGAFCTAGQEIAEDFSGVTGSGNWSGNNPECILNYVTSNGCWGEEIDIATANAPANIRQGLRIVDIGSAASTFGASDSAIVITDQPSGGYVTAIGFKNGLYFGEPSNNSYVPVAANGTFINFGSNSSTYNAVIDMHRLTGTMTNGAIILPNNAYISAENSTASGVIALIGSTTGNIICLACGSSTTVRPGGIIEMNNATEIQAVNAAASGADNLIEADASDVVQIGNNVSALAVNVPGAFTGHTIGIGISPGYPLEIVGEEVLVGGVSGGSGTGASFNITPNATGSSGVTLEASYFSGGYGPIILKTGGSVAATINTSQQLILPALEQLTGTEGNQVSWQIASSGQQWKINLSAGGTLYFDDVTNTVLPFNLLPNASVVMSLYSAGLKVTGIASHAGDAAVCIGTGTVNTSGLFSSDTSGTICGLSALRYKILGSAVRPEDELRGVMTLRTDSWRYRPGHGDEGKAVHVGLIADDVAAVDPRCGDYDDGGEIDNYSDRCIEAYLVGSIQALQAEVEKLKEGN